jgi:hypothetical protein
MAQRIWLLLFWVVANLGMLATGPSSLESQLFAPPGGDP